MIRRTDGLGVLVVVIVSAVVQHLLFSTTFMDSIGPAVAAAGGYVGAVVAMRRLHEPPNAKERRLR